MSSSASEGSNSDPPAGSDSPDRATAEQATADPTVSGRVGDIWRRVVNEHPRSAAAHLGAIAAMLAVTVYRLVAASRVRFPGHADSAFYYDLSRNIGAGRGLTIDFVWQFSPRPLRVEHYAPDYWMPLPSLIMAAMAPITGSSPAGATRATVLVALMLAPATYWLCRQLTTIWWAPPLAAVLAVTNPIVSVWSMQIDAGTYAALFTVLALAAAAAAGERRGFWVLSGALVSAAFMCRSDAIVVYAVALALGLAAAKPRARWAAAWYSMGAGVAITPLLIANQLSIGQPLGTSFTRGLLMSSFEELYAWNGGPNAHSWGEQKVSRVLQQRVDAADSVITPVIDWFGWPLLGLIALTVVSGAVVAVIDRRRENRGWAGAPRQWAVLFAYAAGVPAMTILATPLLVSGGTTVRWSVVLASLVSVASATALTVLARRPQLVTGAVVVAALLVGGSLVQLPHLTDSALGVANAGGELAKIGGVLNDEARLLGRDPVVMTRFPWQVTALTGYPSVMAPSDGFAASLEVAKHYGVTHVLFPTHRPYLALPEHLGAFGSPVLVAEWDDGTALYRVAAS